MAVAISVQLPAYVNRLRIKYFKSTPAPHTLVGEIANPTQSQNLGAALRVGELMLGLEPIPLVNFHGICKGDI